MSQFENALKTANNNLKKLYKKKHKTIKLSDVLEVYDRQILSINSDAKTIKGLSHGYLTGILYLAPHKLSGVNFCPKASPGCIIGCLNTAGRGVYYTTMRARILKSLAYIYDKKRFELTLKESIRQLTVKAKNKKLLPVVRLNGTSDLPFYQIYPNIFSQYSEVIFYDYTKESKRFNHDLPANYSLTFSLSEVNEKEAKEVLGQGFNIAAVFRTNNFPEKLFSFPVTSGDASDLRFLDLPGVVVGLKAKGKAKKDKSGFVLESAA